MIPTFITALVIDMDGVLWRADQPIGDLSTIFRRIHNIGLKISFATNNGTRTPDQYIERLASFGVKAESWQVITSALGVAYLLRQKIPTGSSIFAIGETGIMEALSEAGYNLLSIENAKDSQAVVVGLDRKINFDKMREATLLVKSGVPFFATNDDKTFPTPRGEIPGAGAWLSVITTATGIQPIVAGKPSPYLIDLACERMGTKKSETLVVGDRLETDILGGQNSGCPVALVLSGVSTRLEGEKWKPPVDIIADDLSCLIS